MTGPQEVAAAIGQVPGLAKAIESSAILVCVTIGAVLIFQIVKLALTLKFRTKNGNPGPAPAQEPTKFELNPAPIVAAAMAHPQIQGHLYGAVKSETKIDRIDTKTEELCKCMITLTGLVGTMTEVQKDQKDLLVAALEKRA